MNILPEMYRQRNNECGTGSGSAPGRDASAVEPLEWSKNLVEVLLTEADAIFFGILSDQVWSSFTTPE